MVKTAKSHYHHDNQQEDDFDDGEDIATPGTDGSSHKEGKTVEQKASNSRSKHSENEQRRRSKINERFQVLKELIPPNDQKRDKASLLLEVIEYIHFLRERLQMYEGPYLPSAWGQEPAKLIPWRGNQVPTECCSDPSLVMNNGSGLEKNTVQSIGNAQISVQPHFRVDPAYGGSDHLAGPATSAVHMNMQTDMYACAKSALQGENPQLQPWPQGLSIAECTVAGSGPSDQERTADGNGVSEISTMYARGLLKNLTQAFQASGVDLSQPSISVNLDIGQQANSNVTAGPSVVEGPDHTQSNQLMNLVPESDAENLDQPAKRLKMGEG